MFLLGVLAWMIIIVISVGVADLNYLIYLPSILFVLLSNLAILISTNSFKSLLHGFRILILNNIEIRKSDLDESIKTFELLIKSSILISLLGFIIGTVNMLHRLTDPSSVGPYMSLALLIIFYSIVLDLVVLIPGNFLLKKKDNLIKESSK
ncbi:MotA/TolQ/ExbB proton channel family protein [Sporosalibacterium faouarense]|uniref:MotA/TolQ/ExbB proton channel family protein n=1 Tax=Sporosalibacterium faouarense TaxID=516123 RepID=UPI00192C2227|nr:MotA/TolQ/ExbB proton channel family protein [Sporosalibacterium faouarense]